MYPVLWHKNNMEKHLIYKMAEGGEHSLYIVTNYNLAPKVIQNVKITIIIDTTSMVS